MYDKHTPKKKKFTVVIEETVCEEFEVSAETAEEAERIAEEKYQKGEFVLEPGEVQDVKFAARQS